MTYPKLKILSEKEKQEILNKLKKQFGVETLDGILVQQGAERIFLYQGSLTGKEIKKIENLRINIEKIGIYFAKEQAEQIRLSIEGVHLLKNQITKNIFELDKKQAEQWMKGNELDIKTGKREFLIMKYQNDFLGCGKASENKIGNYVSKNRRLKEKS